MLELRAETFNLYLLGVSDETELAEAGSVDVLVELADGRRLAGTFRTLDDLAAQLGEAYAPVTDTVVVRRLAPDLIGGAVDELITSGAIEEVFLEVLEEVEG